MLLLKPIYLSKGLKGVFLASVYFFNMYIKLLLEHVDLAKGYMILYLESEGLFKGYIRLFLRLIACENGI